MKYNPNPCLDCDCYDPDFGCTMSGIDREYACPLVDDFEYNSPDESL